MFRGYVGFRGGYFFCISPKANLSIPPKKNFKTFNNLCFFEVCEEVHKKYKDKSKSTPQLRQWFGCSVVGLKGIINGAAKMALFLVHSGNPFLRLSLGLTSF